ncbi:MAG: hypothetical protein L6Q49_21675 [Anaerolineales bacterium]|nr:hypothetical protein [Anaerolineales bacterium]
MKPKLMLTIGGIWFLIEGVTGFFMAGGFDFSAFGFSVFSITLGILCLLMRNESPSKARNAVFLSGFLSTFGISLVAYYAQWSGLFMDTPIGYIPPTLWLIVAIGFFLVGRANMSAS